MASPGDEFLRPLVTGWLGRINQAIQYKKPFQEVADQCMHFYSGTLGFMWQDAYRRKYLKGATTPKFQITIAKAFEFVALYGPILYNRNPIRAVRTRPPLEFGPELLGDPNDPNVQQQFQQMQQMEGMRQSQNRTRAQLMERWLNYTPGEQPDGGLQQQGEDAVTEALIKGRGVLWPGHYKHPGGQTVLTGAFYDSVDNLLIDPDATSLEDAMWVAKRCVHPYWEVEREYKLPKDSLKEKGQMSSADSSGSSYSEGDQPQDIFKRKAGKTFDLLTYWKIWSKGGTGTRMTGVDKSLNSAFDEVVGDYAYLVVAEDVPWPLNAPAERMRRAKGEMDEMVAKAFEWPIPFWVDGRWPCALLDFYKIPGKPWPLAPLSPGLGELTFLNVVISHLANRIVSSSRDFIGVLKSAMSEVESVLRKGEDLTIIPLPEINNDIGKMIQFLQQPQTNFDVWKIIDSMFQLFDKRVGLTELMYGITETQSRSAEDAQAKKSSIQIRPDYMASRVEKWQSEVAVMEKFMARWFVSGQDVLPLVGQAGSMLWEQLISNEEPEIVLREMDCTVEAGSARKPNKERDVQNINQALPMFMPVFQGYHQMAGDPGPINAMVKRWCDAADMEYNGLQLQPPPPPDPNKPDPEQQELMLKQQESQMKMAEGQQAMAMKEKEAELKSQLEMVKLQIAQAKGEQEIRLMREKAMIEMQIAQMEIAAEAEKNRQEAMQQEQQMAMDQQKSAMSLMAERQKMALGQQAASQELRQDQQAHSVELRQSKDRGKLDLQLSKQKAAAAKLMPKKPSGNGAGNGKK